MNNPLELNLSKEQFAVFCVVFWEIISFNAFLKTREFEQPLKNTFKTMVHNYIPLFNPLKFFPYICTFI